MRSILLYKPDPRALQAQRRTSGFWTANVWLPAVLAMTCIAIESTGTFSSEHTGLWLRPFVQRVFGPLDDIAWDEIHHGIRKTGHFLGYGTVCLTFLRAWLLNLGTRLSLAIGRWRLSSSIAAIFSTFVVAGADEWHQTTLPSRTGQFFDVLLDTSGAACLCLFMWIAFWRRRTWEAHL